MKSPSVFRSVPDSGDGKIMKQRSRAAKWSTTTFITVDWRISGDGLAGDRLFCRQRGGVGGIQS